MYISNEAKKLFMGFNHYFLKMLMTDLEPIEDLPNKLLKLFPSIQFNISKHDNEVNTLKEYMKTLKIHPRVICKINIIDLPKNLRSKILSKTTEKEKSSITRKINDYIKKMLNCNIFICCYYPHIYPIDLKKNTCGIFNEAEELGKLGNLQFNRKYSTKTSVMLIIHSHRKIRKIINDSHITVNTDYTNMFGNDLVNVIIPITSLPNIIQNIIFSDLEEDIVNMITKSYICAKMFNIEINFDRLSSIYDIINGTMKIPYSEITFFNDYM